MPAPRISTPKPAAIAPDPKRDAVVDRALNNWLVMKAKDGADSHVDAFLAQLATAGYQIIAGPGTPRPRRATVGAPAGAELFSS